MSLKFSVKRAQGCFISVLPLILFVTGLVWVFLFPAVSITTGELKPRGLYVDEHSLLVHSRLIGTPTLTRLSKHRNGDFNVCSLFDHSNLRCIYAPSSIIQIEIIPRYSKITHDSTVLVFQYRVNETCAQREVFDLVNSIATELQFAKWNARKVIVLLLPTSEGDTTQSVALQDWLRRHHTPTHAELLLAQGETSVLSVGAMREAYIFDITATAICTTTTSTTTQRTDDTALTPITSTSTSDTSTIQFRTAALLHTGAGGVLPNMDLVAFPLSAHPGVLLTESQVCSDSLQAYLQSVYRVYGVHSDRSSDEDSRILSNTSVLLVPLVPLLHYIDSLLPTAYRARLLGLLCTIHTLSTGTATGLHGYFSHLNIDAITIKPTPAVSETGIQPATRRGLKRAGASSSKSVTFSASTLLEMAVSFVYVSNNLQEELHHSHFYYLLLGSGHFVGINEYGFTAALLLCSVLGMFVQLSAVCSVANIQRAVCSVLVDVLHVVVWVVLVPVLYTSGTSGTEGSTVYAQCMLDSVQWYDVQSVLAYILCTVDYVVYVFKLYVPVRSVVSVTVALHVTACVGALMRSLYAHNDRFSANIVHSVNSANTTTNECVENTTTVDVDVGNINVTQPVITTNNANSDTTTAELCVHYLLVLVLLAYVYAHNFSLALLLTVYVVPCLLAIRYICVLNTTHKIILLLCVTILIFVIMYSTYSIYSTIHPVHISSGWWVVLSVVVSVCASATLGKLI